MRRTLAALGMAALLAGCTNMGAPSDVETAAEGVYDKIVAGDLPGLQAISTPELRAQETQALIDQMKAQIPAEKPTKAATTYWRVNANVGSPTQAGIKRTYTYPSGEILFDAVLQKQDKTWQVAGMHVLRNQPTPGAGQ